MDDLKTEKWTLDDGRRAERRVIENSSNDGQTERVIELHVEDERPLKLQQRVVEKAKPIIFERKIETLDPNTGTVLEQKVESIDPKVSMHLVEHIACSSKVSAQSVEDDCHVTKQEMIDTIIAAIKASRETQPINQIPQAASSNNFTSQLNTLGLANEVAGRVDDKQISLTEKVLLGIVALQILGLGYLLFFM
jgi:hypothetical protein